jgi:hypothetical protein
MLGDLPTGMVR